MHLPDPDYQPEFYGGVPAKRLFAWLVDCVLIVILVAVTIPLTAFIGLFFVPVLFLVLGFAYRYVTIATGSATWGMRFAGIELRNEAGTRLTNSEALLHTAGYTLSISIPIVQLISIVMMLTSARGQGLSDSLLGTVALNRRATY